MYSLKLIETKPEYIEQSHQIYLENQTYLYWGDSVPASKDEFIKKVADNRFDPCFVFVNDDKDDVVGFCATFSNTYNRYTNISYIVKEELRNKGAGKQLLTKTIKALKDLNLVDYLEAHTYDNPISEKLLKSFGFVETGIYPDRIKIFQNGTYKLLKDTIYILKLKN
jgi:RimJ/RimL family protein N-acetyltransferase